MPVRFGSGARAGEPNHRQYRSPPRTLAEKMYVTSVNHTSSVSDRVSCRDRQHTERAASVATTAGDSSTSDARIAADSFAINARSSALVLHWRTERISSLRFRHATGQVRASGARDKGQRRGRVSSESFSASSGWVEISNALVP